MEMEILIKKVEKELKAWCEFLKEEKDYVDYHRACASAWSFQHIGLITMEECMKWVNTFSSIYHEVTK